MQITFDLPDDIAKYIDLKVKEDQDPSPSAALYHIICDYICKRYSFWDYADFAIGRNDSAQSTLFFYSKPYYDKYWPGGKSILISCYSVNNIMLVRGGTYYLRWAVKDDFAIPEDITDWPYFMLKAKMGPPEVVYARPEEF